MSKEAAFLAIPEEFEHILYVYPPKVKDIVGSKHFSIYRHILTLTQEELEDEYIKKKEKHLNMKQMVMM